MKLTPEAIAILDKTIAAIETAKPELCEMYEFENPKVCGTAYCVAGWIAHANKDHLEKAWSIITGDFGKSMSVEGHRTADELFYMGNGPRNYKRCETFDKLPAQERKDRMLGVLRHFRETGEVDWKYGEWMK